MNDLPSESSRASVAQWLNLTLILLFYLALSLSAWFGVPAWMELLGLRSQSAGGGAAMMFLFFGLPMFLVSCLLFVVTTRLPSPEFLPRLQAYQRPALLILLAWQVAFFILDSFSR
jgi:hypothetical protein